MARVNAPYKDITKQHKGEGTCDYRYKYTNIEIYKMRGSTPIWMFIRLQHVNYIAHVVRMENSCLEKQSLFMAGMQADWKKLEKESGMDRSQIIRTMSSKKTFDDWLNLYSQQLIRGTRDE